MSRRHNPGIIVNVRAVIETKELAILFTHSSELWDEMSEVQRDQFVRESAIKAADGNPQVDSYLMDTMTYEVEHDPVIEIVGKRVELTNMVLIKAKMEAVPAPEV